MTDAPILDLQDVTVAYRRNGTWTAALRQLSLTIAPNEAYGLVGESGSGKSTVAMTVMRYLPRNGRLLDGRVLVEGRDLFALVPEDLRRLRGNRIAMVYQNAAGALNPSLPVGTQIAEVLRCHHTLPRPAAHAAMLGLLDRLRIADPARVAGQYPHQLSGGMQQRAVIAMALAGDPVLLVLDEPTSALDASVAADLLFLLGRLRRERNTAFLLISHDPAVVHRLCDRVGVLRDGVLVEQGPCATVLARPRHPYTAALLAPLPPHPLLAPLPPRMAQSAGGITPTAHPGFIRPPVLEADGIALDRHGRAVLRDMTIAIAEGETFGLVGESGSGKTSFARVLAGLEAPSAGTMRLDTVPLPHRRSRIQRRAIQMVFQSPDATLNPSRRIGPLLERSVKLLAGLRGAAKRHKARTLLASVELTAVQAGAYPAGLSGGQRQRVAIARALAGDPRVVILDEPTSALDHRVRGTILSLLIGLQQSRGIAFLLISHDLAVIRHMADRIGVMLGGMLVEVGPAERIAAPPHHPYTALLLSAASGVPSGEESGMPRPEAANGGILPACPFQSRCHHAEARCTGQLPPWRDAGGGHRIRCWLPLDTLAHTR